MLRLAYRRDGGQELSRTLTRNLGAVFNTFESDGRIVGALGQTDDLTPEVIQQMMTIDSSMVLYFKAEQLAAMSDEVFAALPDDYIAGLDGITRDQLAAKALAALKAEWNERADQPSSENLFDHLKSSGAGRTEGGGARMFRRVNRPANHEPVGAGLQRFAGSEGALLVV